MIYHLCTENAPNRTKILKSQLWEKGLTTKNLRRCNECEYKIKVGYRPVFSFSDILIVTVNKMSLIPIKRKLEEVDWSSLWFCFLQVGFLEPVRHLPQLFQNLLCCPWWMCSTVKGKKIEKSEIAWLCFSFG